MISAFANTLGRGGKVQQTYRTPLGLFPQITVNSTKVVAQDASYWIGRVSMAKRSDGVIVMSYVKAPDHGFYATTTAHLRFSDDYGETWTDEDTKLDGDPVTGFPLDLAYDPVICRLILCPNGDILRQTWNTNSASFAIGAWQSRSTDGGETWSTHTRVTFTGYTPSQGNDNTTYFNEDFTVVGDTIYAPIRHYLQSSGENEESWWCTSQDNGATWVVTTKMSSFASPLGGTNGDPPDQGAGELGLTYVGNDQFVSVSRVSSIDTIYRFDIDNSVSPPTVTNESIYDEVSIAAGRQIMYQRAQMQGIPEWWRDPVIFVFGFEFTSPGFGRQRRHTLLYSKDKGATWGGPIYLDQTWYDGGYGDAFFNPVTNEYVFVSYVNEASDEKAYLKQYNISIKWN